MTLTADEQQQRHAIYQYFKENGKEPSENEMVELLGMGREDAFAALDVLAEKHALVLSPGSHNIWMMHPFSGVPTEHVVVSDGQTYWANCGWDILGVPVVVGMDAEAQVDYQDGTGAMEIKIEAGELVEGEGVVHFAVPAKRFWDDVGYT